MDLTSGTCYCAVDAGRQSTSRSSRSRTGNLHEAATTQHQGSNRQNRPFQSPVQQQDVHMQCVLYQCQQQQQGNSAMPQPACCCGSAKQQHDLPPGQIRRPSSRLENHNDIHSSCHQHRPGSKGANHNLVDSGMEEAGMGTGLCTAVGHDYRQPGSRCVHSSMGYYSGDASQNRPISCSTSGNGLRSSRPGTGSSGSTKQQQHMMTSGAGENVSLNGSYGMEPISEQHYASTATANPLYANSSAAALLSKSSGSDSRNTGKASSPMVSPRKSAGSYAAGFAAAAVSLHSSGSVNPNASNTVQPANSTRPGSSSGRSAGSIRNLGTLRNDNIHSPRQLRSSAATLMEQKQQLPMGSSPDTGRAPPKPHMQSRQGSRPTSGLLRASSTGGSTQQRTACVYKPQPGLLSQDPDPISTKVAAAYLGRGSSSRPSSASGQQGPSAAVHGKAGLAGELRSPYQQQVQKSRQQSAISATPASVVATPRSSSNSQVHSSSKRPSSAARGRPQTRASQEQLTAGGSAQVAEAAGPLLSEYFRPPSAAAPGCVGLFGLPGMEPPGGLASAIPCVKVPSVHASWDAAVAGLSSSHSSGVESPSAAAAAAAATQHSGVGQQQQQEQPAAARAYVQPQHRPVTQLGPARPSTISGTSQSEHARPGTSSRAQRPGTVGCLATDSSDASKQQLLLWSAAHEIDGRPVTRNGERARAEVLK